MPFRRLFEQGIAIVRLTEEDETMNKKFCLRFAEAMAFLVLLVAIVAGVSRVVEHKEGRTLLGGYLEEPQAYDVLFFGDSKCITGMVPMEMYDDYGIAAYNLACYSNFMPVSYWTLINALDYGTPELAVLSVNGLAADKKVTTYSPDLHTALDFWPLTKNKVRMINDLLYDPENPDFTDSHGVRYQDLKWEYFFTLGKYHSRWSELKKEDFTKRPAHIKGGEFKAGVYPVWEYTLVEEDNYEDEVGYGYEYLRAAIEECLGRGIEVLLVMMPNPLMINSQRAANTVRSIASEYGVNFVDTTRLDSIVDYAVDCFDEDPHLNTSGTLKMTDFLGSYISSHYDLPDRRADAEYAHWQEHLRAHKDEKFNVMREQEELNHVLMLLHDTDYDFSLYLGADAPVWYDEVGILLMHNIARRHVLSGEEYAESSSGMFPLEGFDRALTEGGAYYLHRESGIWTEHTGAEAEAAAIEVFGKEPASQVMIKVRDARTGDTEAVMQF